MYTATMHYYFQKDKAQEAAKIWRAMIPEKAQTQDGFIRIQWLVSENEAMAIGTWSSKEHAQAFMQTGIFKQLMTQLKPLISKDPEPHIWNLDYFAE